MGRRKRAIRQELPGHVDVEAVAAGAADCPWRARPRKLETMIERASDDHIASWFPASLDDIVTRPSGRAWVGGAGNHLYLFRLEKEPIAPKG